jgi:hypothetical protein
MFGTSAPLRVKGFRIQAAMERVVGSTEESRHMTCTRKAHGTLEHRRYHPTAFQNPLPQRSSKAHPCHLLSVAVASYS